MNLRNVVKKSGAILGLALILMGLAVYAAAGQSVITEVEGYACMGDDRTRRQTETEALTQARRAAAEYATTYIRSESRVQDMQLEKDLVDAYAKAEVRILQELTRSWYKDSSAGDCFKVQIRAEVLPDNRALAQVSKTLNAADNPAAPLTVQVWTDQTRYRTSEQVKIFLKGNRPFFGRILYREARGQLLQLLPNPYRSEYYFQGGVVYEIPSGNDQFTLNVSAPFGEEKIIVYASSSPLGSLDVNKAGSVYEVKTKAEDLGGRVRGITISSKNDPAAPPVAGFVETSATLMTQE